MKEKICLCLLLCLLLLATGCGASKTAAQEEPVQTAQTAETDGGSDEAPQTQTAETEPAESRSYTVTTAQELEDALCADVPVGAIDIVADMQLTSNCTVQHATDNYNQTVVTVAEGVTVTVAAGGVFGDAWYTFTGEDWSVMQVSVVNSGTIVLENGGTLNDISVNYGTILVRSGGELGASVENAGSGSIRVESGGAMHTSQGAPTQNNGTVEILSGGSLTAAMGGWIENRGTLCVDGEMTVNGAEGGRFIDGGGSITGSGVIVIDSSAGCEWNENTFSAFTGTLTVDGE